MKIFATIYEEPLVLLKLIKDVEGLYALYFLIIGINPFKIQFLKKLLLNSFERSFYTNNIICPIVQRENKRACIIKLNKRISRTDCRTITE